MSSVQRAVLIIQRPGEANRSFPIEGDALVGRSVDCGIRLEDQSVSRKHASLRVLSGGNLELIAASEFSPVRLNGVEIQKSVVKPGDELIIGPFRLF